MSVADVSANLREAVSEVQEEMAQEAEPEVEAEPAAEADFEMHEAEFTLPHIEPEDIVAAKEARERNELNDVEHGELSFSLFAPTADSGTPTKSSRKTTGFVSPPGSFLPPESEDEHEEHHDVEEPAPGDMRLDELTTPPLDRQRANRSSRISRSQTQPSLQPARVTRTRSAQLEAQLTRRIPGAFVDDVEDEEADLVPPLPAATSTTSMLSTGTSRRAPRRQKTKEELKTPSRPTRRSSRLSQISSSSDEMVSPEKERTSRSKKTLTRSASATQPPPSTRSTRSRKVR